MSISYAHTNIISKNWEKLAKFYQEVFDCIPIPPERNLSGSWLDKGIGGKNVILKGIHLRLPGFGDKGPTLEIYQYEDIKENYPPRPNRKGFGHIAFHVDNVEEIYQKVLLHGGQNLGEITTQDIEGVGKLTFVYMTDPDGNIIEIQNWA